MAHDVSADDVVELLRRAGEGDRTAQNQLFLVVDDVLRQIARGQLRVYGRGATTQTTDLVDQGYLKIVGKRGVSWQGLAHFYGIAGLVMRDLAVDHRRRRRAAIRGGGVAWGHIDQASDVPAENACPIERLELHDALKEALADLAAEDESLALVAHMHYIEDQTYEQIARELKLPLSTAKGRGRLALTKLYQALKRRGFDQ